jgi:hypothetical protein
MKMESRRSRRSSRVAAMRDAASAAGVSVVVEAGEVMGG